MDCDCCAQSRRATVKCSQIISCVNIELEKFANSDSTNFASLCPSVSLCIDDYLVALPGYSSSLDKVLSTVEGEIEWVELTPDEPTTASMGLSMTGTDVMLGQTLGAVGAPATVTEDREIPLGSNSLFFFNSASTFPTFRLQLRATDGVTHGTEVVFVGGGTLKFLGTGTSNGSLEWRHENIVQNGTGIHLVGSTAEHFFMCDMRGSVGYASIESNGTSSANFGAPSIGNITQLGLKGKTVFGAALTDGNTKGLVHIEPSTSALAQFHLASSGATIPSSPADGNLWHANDHIFARLGGVTYQLDSTYGVSLALSSGTITINTTRVTSSSVILLTHATSSGTLGILSVGTIINGTSFVINSTDSSDTSTVNWLIIN